MWFKRLILWASDGRCGDLHHTATPNTTGGVDTWNIQLTKTGALTENVYNL